MESNYKNVLANKFMRDTNYIIIKDTDDIEELERQYELFLTQLTVRQQRLSDDRSIEIWNMTNQQHYETLKKKLMEDLDDTYTDTEQDTNDKYFYDADEEVEDDDIDTSFDVNFDIDYTNIEDEQDVDPYLTEDTNPIPSNDTTKSVSDVTATSIYDKIELNIFKNNRLNEDLTKNNMADQYEIDTNINIMGTIKGDTFDTFMSNLDAQFAKFNAQSHDHRKKSDDKCREIYGMSNLDRYNQLKAKALEYSGDINRPNTKKADGVLDKTPETELEYVSSVYRQMQVLNEQESIKHNSHRKFNDTPYFTPSELIDMGVHGNHNFYSNRPDNESLINKVTVATWFDNYRDMCMDHIFENHTHAWINTLDMLYSDFESIKESKNEEKILARKQSILDLGWNPEIPFNRENRKKATKRVNKILDETVARDIFIDLNNVPEDEVVEEIATSSTHKPVFLVFVQGKTPIVSSGIKYFSKSEYSHSGISFTSSLDTVNSYNISGNGVVRESIKGYKDSIVSIMAFFAPNNIIDVMKDKVSDFESHKTEYDFSILLNKVFKIDRKFTDSEYKQVCSTFVDTILHSGKVDLSKDINIPDPGQLYNAAKSIPNKIIEVYKGPANKYDEKKVNRKLSTLLKKKFVSIEEGKVLDKIKSKKNDFDYEIAAKTFDILAKTTKDEKKKADAKKKADSLRLMKGFTEATLPQGYTLRPANKDDIDYIYECEMQSIDSSIRNQKKTIDYIKKDAKDSVKNTKIVMYNNERAGMITICDKDKYGYYWIGEIYIEPEHRNKGIGTALLKEQIAKYDKLSLGVAESNTKAKKLYESLGFRVYGHNKEEHHYLMVYEKETAMTESFSILNEVKRFPIEFDKDGNLIIYKARIGSLTFGDEIDDSVQLLQAYRNTNNVEGIKYELAKLWYINDCIEKSLKKRHTNDEYKKLIDTRSTCLNVFKQNLEYVMKAEKGFNFSDYYNETPFSDNSIRITSDTIKYTTSLVKSMI